MVLPAISYPEFPSDPDAVCERAALRECVDHAHEWTIAEQDKASVLIRALIALRQGQLQFLLYQASRRVYQALIGPWCGIRGRYDEPVYPELRWCNFPGGVVCYRGRLESPLKTKQFEAHREHLEELWCGPVLIQTGAQVGASPGAVVVRPAGGLLTLPTGIPVPPRQPLSLPARIPLIPNGSG